MVLGLSFRLQRPGDTRTATAMFATLCSHNTPWCAVDSLFDGSLVLCFFIGAMSTLVRSRGAPAEHSNGSTRSQPVGACRTAASSHSSW